MKFFYTLLTILTVSVGSAQTSRSNIVTVTPFTTGEGSYLHMQGRVNLETNCFTGVVTGTSYDLDYQGQGQDVDLFIDNAKFRVVDGDPSFLTANINRWSTLNKVYEVRANNWPAETSDEVLDCPDGASWYNGPNDVHWFINSEFEGWAYNEYYRNGLYFAALTNQYTGFANNNRYNPGGDLNVPYSGGYRTIALLEANIESFIAQYEGFTEVTWNDPIRIGENGNLVGTSTAGAHTYTLTFPSQHLNYVEASWVYTDANDFGHRSSTPVEQRRFIVESTPYYYHSISENEYPTLELAQAAHPGSTNIVMLHRYTPDQVRAAQATALEWIDVDLFRFLVNLFNTRG